MVHLDRLVQVGERPGNFHCFEPGALLGSVFGELGLRWFLEERGHAFVVASDKELIHELIRRQLTGREPPIDQLPRVPGVPANCVPASASALPAWDSIVERRLGVPSGSGNLSDARALGR
jgi:hypothetical protein